MNPEDPFLSTLLPAESARWIWLPDCTGLNHYVEFQRVLPLESVPKEAWIQLSAETSLRLRINGKLVYSGPPREVPPYFYYDNIDLHPHLREGTNEIHILAHHQGADSQSYQAGTPAILIGGQLTDGSNTLDLADLREWQARKVARYSPNSHRLFFCIGFSEDVDFSAKELPWQQPVEVARHPWPERPQGLPRDLPEMRPSRQEAAQIQPHDGGILIDFGQEVSGYVELSLRCDQPTVVRVQYGEALEDDRVNPQKGGMQYEDMLRLPVGTTSWRSYEKRAFRYIQLSAPVEVERAVVAMETYPYQAAYTATETYRRNTQTNEGRLINHILDISARTIELNSEDLLTDCPWRERAQYFDCYFYMEAMQRLFGTVAPIRRFLNQFPRGADKTGLLRMCYPSPGGTTTIPDFSISYAIQLQSYLRLTGDRATVEHNLHFAERGVTAFAIHEDENGLLTDVPGWIFIDNTFELPKFPRSAALNAVYHGGHLALAALFREFGQKDRAIDFESRAAKLRTSFRCTFVREDRVLDSDSTPHHDSFVYWNYHHSAETGHWTGKSFRLRIKFRQDSPKLRLAAHGGVRAWIDGSLVADIKAGGSWTRSALYQPVDLPVPAGDIWHQLDLEVEWNGIDWECFLSSAVETAWSSAQVWEEAAYGTGDPQRPAPESAFTTRLRRYSPPWMTQATVGHAAFHGLLEPDEARRFLLECLPKTYPFPYVKRTTPFFATIDDRPDPRRILPCNVPASMFHFCHALKRNGLGEEARQLLLPIYRGMIERGATTWWEEWNTRSSLCHAWASFVVLFLDGNEN